MSATGERVDRLNDVLTIVDDTVYVVHLISNYGTLTPRDGFRVTVTAHMTKGEARALLAGLQEALG